MFDWFIIYKGIQYIQKVLPVVAESCSMYVNKSSTYYT